MEGVTPDRLVLFNTLLACLHGLRGAELLDGGDAVLALFHHQTHRAVRAQREGGLVARDFHVALERQAGAAQAPSVSDAINAKRIFIGNLHGRGSNSTARRPRSP